MPKPRCPFCNYQGPDVATVSPLPRGGHLVICRQCAAVFGVLPPQPAGPLPPAPEPAQAPKPTVKSSDLDLTVLNQKPPTLPLEPVKQLPYPALIKFLVDVANADISQRAPYNPQAAVAQMKFNGYHAGSQYLRIAQDYGPPLCSKDKTELARIEIPAGFKNSGVAVWVCPNYDCCGEWMLA